MINPLACAPPDEPTYNSQLIVPTGQMLHLFCNMSADNFTNFNLHWYKNGHKIDPIEYPYIVITRYSAVCTIISLLSSSGMASRTLLHLHRHHQVQCRVYHYFFVVVTGYGVTYTATPTLSSPGTVPCAPSFLCCHRVLVSRTLLHLQPSWLTGR